MNFATKEITLKNGEAATLRAPRASDSREMIEYMKRTAAETEFLTRYPEECIYTEEGEAEYLQNMLDSEDNLMIVAVVNGKIAGNCQIVFNSRIKTAHRATVMIALLEEYCSLRLGTAMFDELIAAARRRKILQLELEVLEGNTRAIGLYRKMGFEPVAALPNAFRMRDGSFRKLLYMIKDL